MIEIKEQAYGLGLCVQKVKKTQGIVYPDVSSCLTFTSVLKDEFVGAHVGLFDKAANIKKKQFDLETLIRDATIFFIKKRFEFLVKDATTNFVIGWIDSWQPDKLDKLLKGQFEQSWRGNLWNVPGDCTSSNIKFLSNGKIDVELKKSSAITNTISLSWQNPKKQDDWFQEIGK